MRTLKYIGIALMAALLSVGLPSPAKVKAQPGVSVSFQIFFNSLSPFGRWSNHPQYGSIWVPSVNRDFHPYYTDGRWVMTEYGNTWVSDYDWGWAPFHYGRWFYDDYMGWAWVPDYTWGPGWVNWRTGGGYYGWAPLMPGFNVRLSVNLPVNFWIFVPQRHFMHSRWHRYSVPRARVTNIYHQTTIINNYYNYNNHEYAYGPRSSEIRVHSRSAVPVYTYSNRGNNGGFRESVTRSNNASTRTAVASREQNFIGGRSSSVAPASGRTANPVNSNPRSSSSTRTGTSVTPRSSAPVTNPDARESTRERTANPTSERAGSYTPDNGRSREAVTPRDNSSGRGNSSGVRNEGYAPSRSSGAREGSTGSRSRMNETPSAPTRTERTAPAENRSRESVSPSRSSSRESASPSRSASPTRSTTPSESGGRGSRGSSTERGGRQ